MTEQVRHNWTSAEVDAVNKDIIRVLLVDDQPLLRMGFRLILEGEEDLHVVGEAISASQAATRVIILTTFDLDEYAFAGLQAGASAFLLKDVAPSELVQAVQAGS